MKNDIGQDISTTALSIIILLTLGLIAVFLVPYVMKIQNRKNCIILQQDLLNRPNFQVKPQVAEYCYTKFNIEFKP